jgi:hypothetical protein
MLNLEAAGNRLETEAQEILGTSSIGIEGTVLFLET